MCVRASDVATAISLSVSCSMSENDDSTIAEASNSASNASIASKSKSEGFGFAKVVLLICFLRADGKLKPTDVTVNEVARENEENKRTTRIAPVY